MIRAGDNIGPYTLISKLGRGSFGIVWLAERRTAITTTKVALKMPIDDDVDLEIIKQEANLWVQVSGHPNVLPIIEANIYDGQIIIASEYAPDGSLTEWLKQYNGAAPSIQAAIDMASGILSGLEHLHSKRIIHRDLKPDNILLQGETPRLTDFGIARVLKSTSQSAIVAGTPAYMAPEAFDGKRSEQTDLWSVGVMLYQFLAGVLPFPQKDIPSLMGALLTRNPDPLHPSVPIPMQKVIANALHKNPALRYRSAVEMWVALKDSFRKAKEEEIIPPINWVNQPKAQSLFYTSTVEQGSPVVPKQSPVKPSGFPEPNLLIKQEPFPVRPPIRTKPNSQLWVFLFAVVIVMIPFIIAIITRFK